MARTPRNSLPKLRRHATGQAVVTLSGHDHYLGVWPPTHKHPPASIQQRYDSLVAEWIANGRRPLLAREVVTVDAVLVAFWTHAESHYRDQDGNPTGEAGNFRDALRPVHRLFGSLPASEFSPSKLKAVRQAMIDAGLNRTTVNRRIARVRQVFRWAVGEEMIPADVWHALKAVDGLKAGRSGAKERPPVKAVPADVIERTLPHLPPGPAAMVRVQVLTGMRPGELCRLTPDEIDRSGPVWVYRPSRHKKRHLGKGRAVAIGPQAQSVLTPFLDACTPGQCLFRPDASEAARRSGSVPRTDPRRPGDRYTPRTYRQAVERACARNGIPHWHPNQLRHTHATAVRARYGVEAAAASLGHDRLSTTEIYAERDMGLATRIASEMG